MESSSIEVEAGEMTASEPKAAVKSSFNPPLLTNNIFDWRTVDPSTIEGEGPHIDQLRFFCEKIGEMLQVAEGQYVLIVDREIVSYFPDLESAAEYAIKHFRDRPLLVKKATAIGQIHNLGGVID